MRKGNAKEPYKISYDINQFLFEKDRGESLTALIVSLGMYIKRNSLDYPKYRSLRQETIERLMKLTDISENEFRDTLKMLKESLNEREAA